MENPKRWSVLSKLLTRLTKTALIYPVRFAGVEFSPKLYAFNVLALTVMLIIGYWSLLGELNAFWMGHSTRFKNAPQAVVAALNFTLMTLPCTMAVFGSPSRHATLMDIQRVLDRVDRALDGVAADRRVEWCTSLLVVFHTLLYAFDCNFWLSVDPSNRSYCVIYAFHHINLMAVAMYAQSAWCIGHRFDTVNRELEAKLERLSATKCTEFVIRKYQRLSDLIICSNACRRDVKYFPFTKFQELYWNLCCAVRMTNDQYGLQLFMSLLQIIINLIFVANNVLVKIFYSTVSEPVDAYLIMLYFAWILSQLCYLFLMVMPPSLAALKAEKTPVIICEYLDIDLTPDDTKQLEIFVLQLHKFKISFSICGVMRLQTSFITRVIGTTITYLMVLVQFQNPS